MPPDIHAPPEPELTEHYARARTLLDSGRLSEAEHELTALSARRPEHPALLALWGVLRDRQGRPEDALDAMAHAAKLRPNDAAILANLGRLHARAARWTEALACYRHSLTIAADQPLVWLDAARCSQRLTQWREAELCARNCLHLQPGHPQALVQLGQALDRQQRFAEARSAYETALALDARLSTAWSGLALMALRNGQLTLAVEQFRHALQRLLDQPLPAAVPRSPRTGFDDPRIEAQLWQTLAALARDGIHAFATAGTLLGLVREGRLLPFDKDLDIGLPFAEMAAAVAGLQRRGWIEELRDLRLINPRSFRHRDTGLVVDLCGYLPDPTTDTLIGGFWQQGQPWSVQRVSEFRAPLQLHRIKQAAGWVWTLEDPETWLATLYGPDWRVPDSDFDTVIAAHNLRGFAPLTECYGLMRLIAALHEGRRAKALATTRHCLRHLPEDALLRRVEAALKAS